MQIVKIYRIKAINYNFKNIALGENFNEFSKGNLGQTGLGRI